MWETQVQSLGQEDTQEEEMTTHSNLSGKFHGQRSLGGYHPWCHKESDATEQAPTISSRLQSMESQSIGHDWATNTFKGKLICVALPTTLSPHALFFCCSVAQHVRLPCPSPVPGACSNSCPSSRWCHPNISSSVVPFSCLQSFPASGSFPVSQLFASGSQSIGV